LSDEGLPIENIVDPRGAAVLAEDSSHQTPCMHREVLATERRAKITDGGRAAPSTSDGRLIDARTLLAGAVEIWIVWKPKLLAGLYEGSRHRLGVKVRYAERATATVEWSCQRIIVLSTDETRHDLTR
jgi:hypothetical protein